jgi:hypothetical protein
MRRRCRLRVTILLGMDDAGEEEKREEEDGEGFHGGEICEFYIISWIIRILWKVGWVIF